MRLHPELIPHAAYFPNPWIRVALAVAQIPPALRCVTFGRPTASSAPQDAVVAALLGALDLSGVWKVKGCEGFGNFWASAVPDPSQVRENPLAASQLFCAFFIFKQCAVVSSAQYVMPCTELRCKGSAGTHCLPRSSCSKPDTFCTLCC